MISEILSAMLVGMLAAVPIGPVVILVAQKSLKNGRWSGFVTGLGSVFADTLFASLGLFTLSLISTFISDNEPFIMLIGGFIIAVVGYVLFYKGKHQTHRELAEREGPNITHAVQAALCALSNPGALVFMFALLAVFGLDAETIDTPVWGVVAALAFGQAVYWYFLSWLVSKISIKPWTLRRVSMISGMTIVVLGAILSVRGTIMLL